MLLRNLLSDSEKESSFGEDCIHFKIHLLSMSEENGNIHYSTFLQNFGSKNNDLKWVDLECSTTN